MSALKFLVKLCDVRPEHGNISALENFANHIYIGTDTSLLLHFFIEGLEEYTVSRLFTEAGRGHQAESKSSLSVNGAFFGCSGDGNKGDESATENDAAPPEAIYTNLLSCTRVSETSTPIEQLQHSPTHPLLFVLCNHRLGVFNSVDLTCLFDIAHCIGCFFVFCPPAPMSGSLVMESAAELSRSAYVRHNTSGINSVTGDGGALVRPGKGYAVHTICAAQHQVKSVLVYELDPSQGIYARAIFKQELLLPQPVLTLVAYGDVVCVGTSCEYSLLSMSDGRSSGVLSLSERSQPPLLALGEDGEVHMRYHHSIVTASMQLDPDVGLVSSPPLLPLPASTAFGGAAPPSTASSGADGGLLCRTYRHLAATALAMVACFPFLFVFTEAYCDVFSLCEEEPIERLPLCGGRFTARLARGQRVFAASTHTIWMATLHSIERQLCDLVANFKVDEAFQLLAAYQRHTGRQEPELEGELRKMSGFACLRRARPRTAMLTYLGHLIDPREVVVHLPECAPPPPHSTQGGREEVEEEEEEHSGELRALLLECGPDGAVAPAKLVCEKKAFSEGVSLSGSVPRRRGFLHRDATRAEAEAAAAGGGGGGVTLPGFMWEGWTAPCPFNTDVGHIHHAWLETFETYPFVPVRETAPSPCGSRPPCSVCVGPACPLEWRSHSKLHDRDAECVEVPGPAWGDCGDDKAPPPATTTRQVPDMGPVSSGMFIERCWRNFKDALVEYFSLRLAALRDGMPEDDTTTTCIPEQQEQLRAARVMEYVLLILALEQGDDRAAYRVVTTSLCLQVVDCYDLLTALGEHRLLCCLLFRRGFVRAALHLLRARVYVSSIFSPRLPSLPHFFSPASTPQPGRGSVAAVEPTLAQRLLRYWRQRYRLAAPCLASEEGNGEQGDAGEVHALTMEVSASLAPVAYGAWHLPQASAQRLLLPLLGSLFASCTGHEGDQLGVHDGARDTRGAQLQGAGCVGGVWRAPTSCPAQDWVVALADLYAKGIEEIADGAAYVFYGQQEDGVGGPADKALGDGLESLAGQPVEVDSVVPSRDALRARRVTWFAAVPLIGPLELVLGNNTGGAFLDVASSSRTGAQGVSSGGRSRGDGGKIVAPNSLSEIFFLLDKMNLPALRELLCEDAAQALCRDEEGCTALHVAFACVMCHLRCRGVKGNEYHPEDGNSNTLAAASLLEAPNRVPAAEEGGGEDAALQALLEAAMLLVDASCPTEAISCSGMSCLDIIAAAGGERYVEVVASALAAAVEVNGVCGAAITLPVMVVKTPIESKDGESVENARMQKFLNLNYSKNFMASLPEKIRERAQTLLKYDEEYLQLQQKLDAQEHELRKEFDAKYEAIFKRRMEIVNGIGEAVTEEEVQRGLPSEHAGRIEIALDGMQGEAKRGIPDFWLRVLSHNATLATMIEEHDVKALQKLMDITSRTIDGGAGSFEVVFTFAPNEYFEEETLVLRLIADEKTEPHIERSPLTWRKGKNLTVKTVTKKQRAKRTGQMRTITREVPCASFFSIFQDKGHGKDEEEDEEDKDEDEDEVINLLQLLHNRIIPCAVLHYTGEADDASSNLELDDEDEEEASEEDN